MPQYRNLQDKIFLVIKGIAMGAANKVPGVSGGVVALVAGFYEEFIFSLQRINGKALKLLFNGRFRSFARYVNGQFLILLITGMVVSYFSISKLLDYLMTLNELFVWSCFFGMIIGSIFYIGKDFKDWNYRNLAFIIGGIVVGLSISLLSPARENHNLLFVFLCGIISVSGMTLPGFSGSFILILLGNYVLLLVDSVNALADTLSDMIHGDFNFIEDPIRLEYLKILTFFTLGSITGMVTFSNLITYLLKHYKDYTIATLLGFIAGSLGVVWPWKTKIFQQNFQGEYVLNSKGEKIVIQFQRYWPDFSHLDTWYALLLIVLGFLLVISLSWYGKKTQHE